MVLVIASIGSQGLLGTEALQSCLPPSVSSYGPIVGGWTIATLQLHQQRHAVQASAHIKGSLDMPPDSETVVPVSICSPSGVPPGRCSLIEPDLDIIESYGVLVGRTLSEFSYNRIHHLSWFIVRT